MRNIKRSLIAVAAALMLSGCGFKDIDKRFFVIAFGLDKGKTHPYEVSLKLVIPSPKTEPGESNFQIVSQEADSVAEAVRLLKSKVDKEFDFAHTRILIIGQPLANRVSLSTMDWFLRRRDIQQVVYMGLGVPDAKTILNVKPKSEQLPDNALIFSFSRDGTESPYIVPEYLFDWYRRYRGFGMDPYLPIVETQEGTYVIRRVAVYKKSDKIMELSPEETQIFNQFVRGYPRVLLKGEIDGKPFTFTADALKTNYRIVTPQGENPEIRFRVKVKGEIEDSAVPLFDRSWPRLEKSIAEQLEEMYLGLLQKLQKTGADPTGFGLRYRAVRHQGDREWSDWQAVYPKVRFHVKAQVKLRGTGIIK